MRFALAFLLCTFAVLVFSMSSRADVGVKKTDQTVEVTLDGQPFATYIFNSGYKPIIWPIIGPTGKEMTRAWPMRKDDPSEKTDHVHQKSFWFDHGNVNGIDFWAETAKEQGKQVQTELVKAEGGKIATIVTKNDWLGPDGTRLLSDVRTSRIPRAFDIRPIGTCGRTACLPRILGACTISRAAKRTAPTR